MNTPLRIKTRTVPQTFVDLGNGNWYYRYDIRQEETPIESYTGEEPETRWSFIQIKLDSKPEYKKCVEMIIRKYITQSQEFDLINSANRVLLGTVTDKTVPAEYLEYLDLLNEIKNKVKADFDM